ncbi:MAG: hypothetical protein Q9212_002986 [Teloschistes hypoglaucus]
MLVDSSCPGAAQTSSVLDKLDNESFLMIPLPDTLKTTSQRLPYLVESQDEWYDPACDSMDFLLLQPLTPSVLDHPPSVSCESRMAEHIIDPYNPHEEAFAADRAFYGLQTGQFSKAMGGQEASSRGMCTSTHPSLPPMPASSRKGGISEASGPPRTSKELRVEGLATTPGTLSVAGTKDIPEACIPARAATAMLERVLKIGEETTIPSGGFLGAIGRIGPIACAEDQVSESASMEYSLSTQARHGRPEQSKTTEDRLDRTLRLIVDISDRLDKLDMEWKGLVARMQAYGRAYREFAEDLHSLRYDV